VNPPSCNPNWRAYNPRERRGLGAKAARKHSHRRAFPEDGARHTRKLSLMSEASRAALTSIWLEPAPLPITRRAMGAQGLGTRDHAVSTDT